MHTLKKIFWPLVFGNTEYAKWTILKAIYDFIDNDFHW